MVVTCANGFENEERSQGVPGEVVYPMHSKGKEPKREELGTAHL